MAKFRPQKKTENTKFKFQNTHTNVFFPSIVMLLAIITRAFWLDLVTNKI
jgi:hypothetical protein